MTPGPVITFTAVDDEGEEREVTLKTVFEVCERCRGKGSHTNPNIDGNGLSYEFVQDDEFMDDYIAGVYDVPCEGCSGLRVVPVPDVFHNAKEDLEAYDEYLSEMAEWCAEQAAERRAG